MKLLIEWDLTAARVVFLKAMNEIKLSISGILRIIICLILLYNFKRKSRAPLPCCARPTVWEALHQENRVLRIYDLYSACLLRILTLSIIIVAEKPRMASYNINITTTPQHHHYIYDSICNGSTLHLQEVKHYSVNDVKMPKQ
jgi:hypothetical protein